MIKKVIVLFLLLVGLIFVVYSTGLAGPTKCPNGAETCFTAVHKITGNLMCFPGTAKSDGPWEPIADGCELEEQVLPVVFPSATPVVVYHPTSTPVPPIATLVSTEPAEVVENTLFPNAVPTKCIQCGTEEDCICLLVTQAVRMADALETQAAKP